MGLGKHSRRGRGPVAAGMALVSLVVAGSASGQARDPALEWRTIRTDHFEIHYHEPLALVARRVAAVAERAHTTLASPLGHRPEGRTQVVLSDGSDAANGSATALPYNAIRLFATSPDDLSTLGDYDDWLTSLVVHEHTHVLHLDNIGGVPGVINAIFGKLYAPNMAQPRWVTEGFATYQESRRTAGGRLRSTLFEMYMRMDALQGRLMGIDSLSNLPDRWPRATAWYLYGSQFVQFLVDRHGEGLLADLAAEYGEGPLPYGLNRAALRTTGRTFTALYDEFLEQQRRHHRKVAARVRARGLRRGRRLTRHGETVRAPRFLDDDTVVYSVADGRSETQLRTIDAHTGERQDKLVRLNGLGYSAPHPDGRHLYYGTIDNHRDLYFFYDLFRLDRETGHSERVTQGLRARYPDVSPDGRLIAFTVSNAGTSHLAIADTDDVEGTRRLLLRNRRFDQVYTPRFSPDGRRIAFSHWRRGGRRDIRVMDLTTGEITDVTTDRALDTGPAWSPDGRWLYFSSDRTGIANIYAWHVESGALKQVTNVIAGAYHPAISPDGERLVYLGYSTIGWDLWGMPLDPADFEPAPEYRDDRPEPSPADEALVLPSTSYDPLPTLLPRSYELRVDQGAFGTEVGVATQGSDVVGWHSYSAELSVPVERGDVNVDARYALRRLPTSFQLRLFRLVRPRGDLQVGGASAPWVERRVGGEVGLSRTFPRRFRSQTLSATYAVSHSRNADPFEAPLDPNDPPPRLPDMGRLINLRLGWSYSDVQRQAWDISPSKGRAVSLGVSVAHPNIGSRFRAARLAWAGVQYVENPWVQHHVLAMRYGGGISAGDEGRRSSFTVGGFSRVGLEEAILEDVRLGGVALRGYPPFSRSGTQFHLAQLEYRFPIVRPQWGVMTLPFYVNRIHGSVFVDYGDAFEGPLDFSTFRAGAGGEVLVDFTLGYFLRLTLRTGLAYGFHEGGGVQWYTHLGLPF
ncbi:MAG: DPP IV N-terminal domain-containing protein [Myxococcota bacterium]